jgi:hypothetical protein
MNGAMFLPCYCINDQVISTRRNIGALVFIALDAICDWQVEHPYCTPSVNMLQNAWSELAKPKSIEIFLVTPQQYSCSPIQLVIHLQANKFTTGLHPKGAM